MLTGRPGAYVTVPSTVTPGIPCPDCKSKTSSTTVCVFPLAIGLLLTKIENSGCKMACVLSNVLGIFSKVGYALSETIDKTDTENSERITKTNSRATQCHLDFNN